MEKKAGQIIKNIKKYFAVAGKKIAVMGISGGVDSALCAALCARAIGPKNVLGLLMPSSFTPKADLGDARKLCKILGIRRLEIGLAGETVRISGLLSSLLKKSPKKEALGNSLARLRMLVLYAAASENDGLVIGTGDKSELAIGYFTKYGDGACDILPIGGLYKTQVREMAGRLGIPRSICQKPSSPRLWKNHSAKGELGADYGKIDKILEEIENGKAPRGKLARKIRRLTVSSSHKRALPPVL